MNPFAFTSPSPQAHKRHGILFLIATLLLLVPMAVSLFLSLRSQEAMPSLYDYLTMAALLCLLAAGLLMPRARQEPMVRALRLGTIAGCVLGVLLACLLSLSLIPNSEGDFFDFLFFSLFGAIPLLIYYTVSGTIFPFQPSFLLSPAFLIGTVVQLLLGAALVVPAELTVGRGGSARQGFLSALIAASYTYLIATLALSIYFLITAGNLQQLTNPEGVCGDLLGDQACSALVSYKSLCAQSTPVLLDFLVLALIAGFIGSLIGRIPER